MEMGCNDFLHTDNVILYVAKPQRSLLLFIKKNSSGKTSSQFNSSSSLPLFLSVSSEGRVEMLGGGSVQIYNLTEEDAGIYTCVADNANTTIEAQAQLTIQGTLSNPHCLLSVVGPQAHNYDSARRTDQKLCIYKQNLP